MDLSEINHKIKNMKREDEEFELREESVKLDPFELFVIWFNEALQSGMQEDPTAMVLATVDENNQPDTRVVLLKELENQQFIFYSHYDSKKAHDLSKNNVAAINFYWPYHSRQIRIRGRVEKVKREKSENYFATRPRQTQLTTHAWTQSSSLTNRKEMDNEIKRLSEKFSNKPIPCPENWGGFVLVPFEYEFFQGRKWRMHDRLFYTLDNKTWKMKRLAP